MRGNISKFTVFSKFFNLISSETHQINGYICPNLLKIRLFSSFDSDNINGQSRINSRNDFNDDNGNFSTQNRVNFGDDRQRSHFGGQNVDTNHDYLSRGTRNDGFSKPIGEDKAKGRTNLTLGDDFMKFNGNVGSDYQPSVRELLNSPARGEKHGGKEGSAFEVGGGVACVGEVESRCNEDRKTMTQDEKGKVSEGADEIFNKMKKSGLIPNAVGMIDGLCKDGLVHEAMKLFRLMREKGTMPEVVVYTAVIEGFCQARNLDDAKRIFKKMQDNGIVANAFSYTVLIKGLCKAMRLDEAVGFCVEMLEAGHSPNVPTFTGLVHELCKEKGLEDAQKFIVTLKQRGFFLDEKAVRVYLDKTGPTSPMAWEAMFGPKKKSQTAI